MVLSCNENTINFNHHQLTKLTLYIMHHYLVIPAGGQGIHGQGWTLPRKTQAFVDIRLRPSITTLLKAVAAQCSLHVSAARPLRLNMTSSIKPEEHNVVQRHQRRTKPQPQGICKQNFVRIGPAVPEICSQTDRHTHTHRDIDRQIG